jgi:hypothetical protein
MMDTGDRFRVVDGYDDARLTGRIECWIPASRPGSPGEYKVEMDGRSGYEYHASWHIEHIPQSAPRVKYIGQDEDGYDMTYLIEVDGVEASVGITNGLRPDHPEPLIRTAPNDLCSAEVEIYGDVRWHVLVCCQDATIESAAQAVRAAIGAWPGGCVQRIELPA